jgi:hypothetical protein
MIDVVWQVTGLASVTAFSALGFVLRRYIAQLDSRRVQRRGPQ